MRPLRFRAFDHEKKIFVLGDFAAIGETTLFDLLNQYSLDHIVNLELIQFTGRQSREKEDIYEGHIVEGDFPYAKRGIIVWDDARCGFFIKPANGGFAAYDKYYMVNARPLTILGHIFTHPELLENK